MSADQVLYEENKEGGQDSHLLPDAPTPVEHV